MRRPVAFRVVASAVVLATVAAMLEMGARYVGAELPSWKPEDGVAVVMVGHPTRLWALSPGRKQNGGVTATINERGFRGEPPTTPKPRGELRVLVLGDSTWFGHGVEDDQTFAAQLEARLRGEGLTVEVLNGGVPGYSTEQTRVQLDELGWSLEPDLLLIGSLWSDNNVDSFRDEDLLRSARAQQNPLYASHFFRLLSSAIDQARGGEGARLVTWTRTSQWPEKGGRRVSLKRYAENLDWMVREAAARGIGAALIAPCNIPLVEETYKDGASWDVYFDAQRRLAAHHGIPYVETLPGLRAAAAGPDGKPDATPLFVDVMHPSPAGHAIFAAAAAEALRGAGWPTDRLLAEGGAFDTDVLVDSRFAEGDPNPSSPQRNLFGESDGAPPLGHENAGAPRDRGAPANDRPTNDRPANDRPAANAPKWALSSSVAGGQAPYRVEVRARGGAVVASAHLGGPGPFSLNVRGDIDDVTLVATDAGGKTATAEGHRGGGAADLLFR